jgi:hypothetical protein
MANSVKMRSLEEMKRMERCDVVMARIRVDGVGGLVF